MSTPNQRAKVELPDISMMFNDAAQIVRPGPTSQSATATDTPAAETDGDKASENDAAHG